jgi:hypothetical protein
LDGLIGGIRGNTIAAIGTINLGSLCIQYHYAPQIYYNLSGKPIAIAFIGSSSNKEGVFSLTKIVITSISLISHVKDEATMDSTLTHGDEFSKELFSSIDLVDFTKPIIGALLSNFFFTHFGQQLAHGDLADDNIMAKLNCLVGFGYKLWENIAMDALEKLDDILLHIMKYVKTPHNIKIFFDPSLDENKSHPLATFNSPFGTMTIV